MSRTTEYTTPLNGTPYYRNVGVIKAVDLSGSSYCIGEISFERFDDQNYQYVVSPYWELIEHLPAHIFSGIPGFDLSEKRSKYYRVNLTPSFIQMRTPGESREDLWELLDEVGLDYYDRFEWLLRSGKRCGDDNLIVVRKRESKTHDINNMEIDLNDIQVGDTVSLNKLYDIATSNAEIAKCIYRLLANGASVYLADRKRRLDASERQAMLYLLSNMLEYENNYSSIRQESGIRRAKSEGKYRGRSKIALDPMKFSTIAKQFRLGEISEEDALKSLGISRSTFYRRLQNLSESLVGVISEGERLHSPTREQRIAGISDKLLAENTPALRKLAK